MEKCKVTFKEGKQKIIIDFTLQDNGDADYSTHFEPEVDMKTNLGLSGQLAQIFIAAIHSGSAPEEDAKSPEIEPA
jgi:hypothetical protein